MANKGYAKFEDYADIDKAPEERERGITINTAHVEYETDKRHYAHVDCPGHADYVKNMITGAAQMDGAILVVVCYRMAPWRRPVSTSCWLVRSACPTIVVFLNKTDHDGRSKSCLSWLRWKSVSWLSSYGFPGDEIARSFKRFRAEGSGACPERRHRPDACAGVQCILELMDAVDEYIPTPERDTDKPFLMPVEDVFSITGRGTVATGRVERGVAEDLR